VGGVELGCNATTGLLNQAGWRRLAGFIEVGLHGCRALLDNHLIQHALCLNGSWSRQSNQGCSSREQWRLHLKSIGRAILPAAFAADKQGTDSAQVFRDVGQNMAGRPPARGGRTAIAKNIGAHYSLSASRIKQDVSQPQFKDGGRTATLSTSRKPITAMQYKAKQTAKGLSMAIYKGQRTVVKCGGPAGAPLPHRGHQGG